MGGPVGLRYGLTCLPHLRRQTTAKLGGLYAAGCFQTKNHQPIAGGQHLLPVAPDGLRDLTCSNSVLGNDLQNVDFPPRECEFLLLRFFYRSTHFYLDIYEVN